MNKCLTIAVVLIYLLISVSKTYGIESHIYVASTQIDSIGKVDDFILNEPYNDSAITCQFGNTYRSPYLSVGLAMMLPSAGHLYIGEWKKSKRFLVLEGIGVGCLLASNYMRQNQAYPYRDFYVEKEKLTDEGIALLASGLIIYYGARLWEYFDVYHLAKLKFLDTDRGKYLPLHYSVDWGFAFQDSEADFDRNNNFRGAFNSIYIRTNLTHKTGLLIDLGRNTYAINIEKYIRTKGRTKWSWNYGYRENRGEKIHAPQIGYTWERGKRYYIRSHRDYYFFFKQKGIQTSKGKKTCWDGGFYAPGSLEFGRHFEKVDAYIGGRVQIKGYTITQPVLLPVTGYHESLSASFVIDQTQEMGIGFRFKF